MAEAIGEEQKNRLAQRLSMATQNRDDHGQALSKTQHALECPKDSAQQLEELVHALENERVIVPIRVEEDPRVTGVHAGELGHDPAGFLVTETSAGPAIAAFSSSASLSAFDPSSRPMGLPFKRVALVALVESAGRVVFDPRSVDIVIPRSATAALAQGDQWLPAWKDRDLKNLLLEQASRDFSPVSDLHVEYAGQEICRIILEIDAPKLRRNDGDLTRSELREKVQGVIEGLSALPRLRAVTDQIQWVPRWVGM